MQLLTHNIVPYNDELFNNCMKIYSRCSLQVVFNVPEIN